MTDTEKTNEINIIIASLRKKYSLDDIRIILTDARIKVRRTCPLPAAWRNRREYLTSEHKVSKLLTRKGERASIADRFSVRSEWKIRFVDKRIVRLFRQIVAATYHSAYFNKKEN